MIRTSKISKHAVRLLIAEASGGNAPALDSSAASSVLILTRAPEILPGVLSTSVEGPEMDIGASCCVGVEEPEL
jgi:hypothetical protein